MSQGQGRGPGVRPGVFDGVRVVDLTHNLNGPYATKLMADMGAEVIKIEEPGRGDLGRALETNNTPGMCGYFMYRNPGKKSISVNLRTPQGVRLVKALVAVSDVFIENRRPEAMKHLGLDYDSLCKIRPDIIMCSSSGFGQYGPLSHLPGGDFIIQAYSGTLWLTGPREAPMPPGVAWIDFSTGTHAFGAVAAALYRRSLTGQGEFIDVSMFDCAFNYHDFAVEEYVLSGGKVERSRQAQTSTMLGPPSGVWKVKDGAVVISGGGEEFWRILCKLMNREEWSEWTDRDARIQHANEITDAVAEFMAALTQDEAMRLIDQAGGLGPPVLTIADVCEHPHVKERELLVEVPHPITGKPVKVPNTPVKFRNTFTRPRGAAPLLGQHANTILSELLGYGRKTIKALWGEGVLYAESAARQPGCPVKEMTSQQRTSPIANWARETESIRDLARQRGHSHRAVGT